MVVPEYPGLSSLENPSLSAAQLQQGRQDMANEMFGIIQHPAGGSKEFQAFGAAALECLLDPERYPAFTELVDSLNQSRQKLPVEHRAQLLRLGFHYILINNADSYPAGGTDPATWLGWFREILNHPYLRGDLEEVLWSYNNQANLPKRYAGIKIAAAAYANLLPEPFTLADVGTAAGLGLVQLEENIRLSNIRIQAARHVRQLIHKFALEPRLEMAPSVGVDILPQPGSLWVEACSTFPSKLHDVREQAARQELYRGRHFINTVYGDLTAGETAAGIAGVRARLAGGRADAASAITSLYEITPEHSPEAVITFESLARTLAIVQDSAEIHPTDPTQLVFNKDIYAPSSHYNLFAKDLSERRQPYVLLGRWGSFRCDTFYPTDELVRLLERQIRAA